MAHKIINDVDNRVEIYFDGKPSNEIRDFLKQNHFRWYPYAKCWYSYKSKHNIDIANKALEMVSQNKSSAITTPVKIVEPKKEKQVNPFNDGDYVIFSKNGKLHFGRIFSCFSRSLIGIGYNKSYKNGIADYEAEFFDADKTVIQTTTYKRFGYIPPVGSVVKFENDDAEIVIGVVDRFDYLGSAAIKTFELSKSGEISSTLHYHISSERILDRLYYASTSDVVHLSVGEKIEYFSTEDYETRKGTITDIESDYSSITVSYQWVSLLGNSISMTESVEVDGVIKLGNSDRYLNRSDFISETHQKNIEYNETIKTRIKSKTDTFNDSSAAWSKKPLYRHQLAGSLLADKYNKFAFFYDTGTGKTVMALNIVEKKFLQEGINFLIIAPKSIIKTAWVDDALDFYPELRLLPLYKGFDVYKKNALYKAWMNSSSSKEYLYSKIVSAHSKFLSDALNINSYYSFTNNEIDEKLSQMAQHYIINPEMFIKKPEYYIEKYGITGIIMDESALLKNYNSKTSKVMREICAPLKYVYLLSGKPAPNNEIEYFSQMKIVAPELFDFSYDKFLSMFCSSDGATKNRINERNKELFSEMVSAKSLIVSKKDCLDLPDTTDIVRLVELPEEIMDDYNELYYECMVLIKGMDDSTIFYSTQSRMAVLTKLRQMASGFFIESNGSASDNRIIVDIHNEKINEVKSIISEIPDEQVIIWCQFQHEIELLEKELSKISTVVTAYGKTKNLEENIDAFKNSRAQYIIAHPKTLKYGVTFTNCHYTIYYSFSYSAEDYDQSHDRNYRLGQTSPCTYFYIQSENTIDEIMYLKVRKKLSNAEFFEQLVKDAAKHGIDYASLKGKNDEEIKDTIKNTNSVFGALQEKLSEDSPKTSDNSVSKKKNHHSPVQNITKVVKVSDGIEPSQAALYKIESEEKNRKFSRQGVLYNKPWEFKVQHTKDDSIESLLKQIPRHFTQTLTEEDIQFMDEKIDSSYFSTCFDAEYKEVSLIDHGDPERYIKTIENSPDIELDFCEMLRNVFKVLEYIGKEDADTACLYYGLMDGRSKSYNWLRENCGKYYDEELDYTYNISPYPFSSIEAAKDIISRHSYKFRENEEMIRRLI